MEIFRFRCAALLKISKRQVYELAKQARQPHPRGVRLRTSVRFRNPDPEAWLPPLVKNNNRVTFPVLSSGRWLNLPCCHFTGISLHAENRTAKYSVIQPSSVAG